ncbi:chaps family protein [Panus rudis PR-1116 ss-1]|nr:chaps family protein [Panus rudis PR-1116 ss-1]
MVDAAACFKDIPELFEVTLGEAVTARTESLTTFRELGPPDLVYVTKSTGRSGQPDLGSYHYLSGIDASSLAPLASYLNTLIPAMPEEAGWFSKNTWKVTGGTYCCYNAFSRADLRVETRFPGGVYAYVVDLRGERHQPTEDFWTETYLTAMMRAILYSDDPTYWVDGYRKLDPVYTPEEERRFIKAIESYFLRGWQVGSDPEIQVATVISNHLTTAVFKYFGDAGRYGQIANIFEKLVAQEPEIITLLARAFIGMNEEVKAIQLMADAIKKMPQCYTLLHVQCDFLRSKGNYEWALQIAKQAVNCAPSEFVTWEKLTDCYIDLGQYEAALLTLNSCPMFTWNGRDSHRNLPAAHIHLPKKSAIVEILPDRGPTDDDKADPTLIRLPAPGLRGTWARAYTLLTRLVSKIGWDELLKTRSAVFVMEEEYRTLKTQLDGPEAAKDKTPPVRFKTKIDFDGKVHIIDTSDEPPEPPKPQSETESKTDTLLTSDSTTLADDNASTKGVRSTTPTPGHSAKPSEVDAEANGLPTIRISTESNRIARAEEEEATPNGSEFSAGEAANAVEKPLQAGGQHTETISGVTPEAFSFNNKRLCERWLDNLFMVLYEDLRVWTIYRAEVAHFKTQQVAYKKTGLEWEIIGDLGLRLHHKEEAKEAYQRCLEFPRYSIRPWSKLLDIYTDEGDIQRSLQCAVRVAAYYHAEYCEQSYPTQMAKCLMKLGTMHGHQKINYSILSMGLPESVEKIMTSYLTFGRVFRVEGWDF